MSIKAIIFKKEPSRLGIGITSYGQPSHDVWSSPRQSVICVYPSVPIQGSRNEMVVTEEKGEDQLPFSERYTIKKSIRELLKDAGTENWDGENAFPIFPESVEIAESMVDLFPSADFLPEVSATPNGEIDFDWTISRDIMLTLSVCPKGKIAYSGIFNVAYYDLFGLSFQLNSDGHYERIRTAESLFSFPSKQTLTRSEFLCQTTIKKSVFFSPNNHLYSLLFPLPMSVFLPSPQRSFS